MKKEKIYNVIIAFICFALWFMPTQLFHYSFVVKSFLGMLFSGNLLDIFPYTIRETLIVVLGCATIIFSILFIIKNNAILKLLTTLSAGLYIILWIVAIFAPFPARTTIFFELQKNANTYILWLLFYFVMLITIIVLTILQYLPPSRLAKTTRIQSQIDELQKQVDELKKEE